MIYLRNIKPISVRINICTRRSTLKKVQRTLQYGYCCVLHKAFSTEAIEFHVDFCYAELKLHVYILYFRYPSSKRSVGDAQKGHSTERMGDTAHDMHAIHCHRCECVPTHRVARTASGTWPSHGHTPRRIIGSTHKHTQTRKTPTSHATCVRES